jgi:CRISPR/Cas system-associated exonuclease Cas4 (RecB family)
MERYLLTVLDERSQDNLIHVSDLVKNTWCPRMLYYRANGVRPPLEPTSFMMQNIYDYGSGAHLKYQQRWRDMCVLWGRWKCLACRRTWVDDTPADGCIRCGVPLECIEYCEVPLADPSVMLVGNADAEVRDTDGNVLVEVKTVAEGTFRAEVPKLLGQYTRTVTLEDGKEEKQVDLKQLWRDLRRPLPSHSRQGQTYIYLRSLVKQQPPVDGIIFLYESKNNQALKEFEVTADDTVAKEVLDRAKDVKFYIDRGRPPKCPNGGCALCAPYEEEAQRGNRSTQTTTRKPVYSGSVRVG